MKTNRIFLTAALALLALLPIGRVTAGEPTNNPETKLREALRNSMLQLRDAQNQVATLQAAQTESDQEKATLNEKIKELNAQLAALTKQSAEQKETSEKSIAALNAKVTDQDSQLTRFKEALEKWKGSYNQLLALARTKEAERSRLAAETILLQRKVEDRETKNAELFKLSNEILARYEKFSLGDALAAKEPFVGSSRVKLENLVQDYQDKLVAQKTIPGEPLPAAATPSTETRTAQVSNVNGTTAATP